MKVPGAFEEKVLRIHRLEKEAENLRKEMIDWLNKHTCSDCVCIEGFDIVDTPTGALQEGDEYCDQWCGFCEDDYSGNYYHPIEGSERYFKYSYSS